MKILYFKFEYEILNRILCIFGNVNNFDKTYIATLYTTFSVVTPISRRKKNVCIAHRKRESEGSLVWYKTIHSNNNNKQQINDACVLCLNVGPFYLYSFSIYSMYIILWYNRAFIQPKNFQIKYYSFAHFILIFENVVTFYCSNLLCRRFISIVVNVWKLYLKFIL